MNTEFKPGTVVTWTAEAVKSAVLDYIDAALVIEGARLTVVSHDSSSVIVRRADGHEFPANPNSLVRI